MIRNYLKIAWRSVIKGKGFSLLNIGGLATGMAGAVLILLWLQNEISFDKFHANRENLYEVYGLTANTDGHPSSIPVVSQPLAPSLKQNFPEVVASTRVKDLSGFLLTADNKSFTGLKGSVVDPAFLDMFTFPLVSGNPETQLKNVYSITITQELALKLFEHQNPIGKIIRIDSVDNFTVTGVLKDLPSNTRFDFEYLLPWDYMKKLGQGYSNESWLSNNTPSFVQLQPNTNIAGFNEKIKNISKLNAGRNDIWTHFLFPLDQWHLYNEFHNGVAVGGRIETVQVFAVVAAFILLIACINFMNLSTARSEKRAKEVGIRKVAGAGKGLLIGQFITEAFLTTLVAAAIALLIVQLLLPAYNQLIGTNLSIPYDRVDFWAFALAFIFLTSLLAGSYPAFYLSSFNAVGIFRKEFKKTQAAISPRRILVVLQFSFAIILIISSIVVRNQIQFAQDRSKGYSANNLLQVNFGGEIDKNYSLIKQALLNDGVAVSVTKTMTGITEGGGRSWGFRWEGENPKDTNTTIRVYSADADLVKTMGFQLLAGRDIDINKYPADSFSVLLNETASKLMAFREPVGQILSQPYENINLHVVGVVKDFISGSPYEQVEPTVIIGPGSWFNSLHIKFDPSLSTAKAISKAEGIFRKYNPAYPFDYKFVDQQYARQFDNEQRTKIMAGIFAGLAILISCLGLLGLSAYMAESRVKEIGVRKVLGASAYSITKLLSTEFIRLVVIAILIASPIAWWAMSRWLQGYSYRINIGGEVFLLAGILAILIALITVSFQSIKSAWANPVKSLRSE